MFDELYANFQATLKQVKQSSVSLGQQLKLSRAQFCFSQNNFHDPTKNLGKAASFPKSTRFKPLQKQQPRTTDSFLDSSLQIQHPIKGPIFTKSERFIPQKEDQLTIINPNYDVIKKNNKQAPKIVISLQKQMGKSRLSQATVASQTEVGPGKYFVNQDQIINDKKTPSFSKSKRFIKQKPQYEDTPLLINQNQIKKRPPTMAVLKKKIQKNIKQISIQQQQQLRQRLKLVYWKSIPLEIDRLLKKQAGAPVLKQKYFDLKKMTGKERKCALLMLLDRLDYQRGGFNHQIQNNIGKGPCPVIYRKSTPKPFKFSQMEPGPDYYYPLDDLIKPNLVGFTFGKQQQKPKEPDNRDYEINQQFLKKGGNVLILPEHKPHILNQDEIRSLNRGPGFYDCLFSQVQKRNDIGIIKFQQVTEKNARQNNCIQIKQVNDGVYFPSYDAIDPNIPGPIYSQPANVKPAHIPDKQLFPQHWLFYDGDLNKIRAQIAKNVLIGNGLTFDQYKKFTMKFKAFKNYMQLRRQQAQKLQYNPKFDIIDPHIQGFQMSKKPQKNLIDPIVKQQFDVDGDNLILQPEKQKKRLAQINFGKMIGRQQNQIGPDDDIEGDVLIIQPKKPQKHLAQINFEKMVARPEIKAQKNEDEQAAQGDRIILNPILPQKKILNIDFSKQANRPGTDIDQNEQKEQLFILPQKGKKIKGFVQMQRMNSVRLVPYLRKMKQNKQKASVISSRSRQKQSKQNKQQNEQRQQDQN